MTEENDRITTSTWNNTNQHWIPQFILKGFGIRKSASTVHELDKRTGTITVQKVKEVASQKHLMTNPDNELMRKIETHAAEAIAAIRKGHSSQIKEKGRKAIDMLVCAMIANDPYNFDHVAQRTNAIGEITNKLNEAIKKHGGTLDETYDATFFDEVLSHDRLPAVLDPRNDQTIVVMNFMGLTACKPANGQYFIIGDSPVLIVRSTINGKKSILNPGSQIILPISSKSMLIYTWDAEKNIINDEIILTKEQVHSLNSDYYRTTCQYVYGRHEVTLKQSRLIQLTWTSRERLTHVSTGLYKMQHLQLIKQKQMEEEEQRQAMILDDGARMLVNENEEYLPM